MRTIQERLRYLCRRAELSPEDLSVAAGLSRRYIRRIQDDPKRRSITFEGAQKLSFSTGVSPRWIASGVGPRESNVELTETLIVWRKQPAEARQSLFYFLTDEAEQSDVRARHEQQMGRGRKQEYRLHRKSAATLRAALAVLKAAERPETWTAVSSTKRTRRRG